MVEQLTLNQRVGGSSPPRFTNNSSNELTSTSAASYTYDYIGNTLTKVVGSGTTSYAWDYENRMTTVTLPGSGGTVSFKYDPFGRRIYKSSSSGTSIYAYDGDNLIGETNSSGGVVARYSQTQNIDEPLAMLRSGATSYYHADGLGSVTSLSSAAGSIANTYTYDSFGKLTNSTGSLVNPFRYTARESDTETDLYYYRARYYDQVGGRFVSEDPIRFNGGPNFYTYVNNSPLNFNDPFGEFPTWWHREMTNQLALAVFGGKCASKAKAVADANANVDAFNHRIGWDLVGSTIGFSQFITNSGEGWAQPGPHFPNAGTLEKARSLPLQTCSLKDLGESLHTMQDACAHSGWSSFDHYTHLGAPDKQAASGGIGDAAMMETVSLLRAFKSKCLSCCQ